jgi:hypothetical protein
MSHPRSARSRFRNVIVAGCLCVQASLSPVAFAAESFTAGLLILPSSGWTPEQTPVDFLDVVGLQTKARWRQLYRQPPPVPSTDRPRAAFTLGALVGDALLALQAEDSQQFRNTNQDVLAYCRVLGLGEKVSPRLMAMAKLAEENRWADLRQEAVDGQQELSRLLIDQRDEELAALVDLGTWLRTLELASTLVLEAPEQEVKPLCIGAHALLMDLQVKFSQLPEATRIQEAMVPVGETISFLVRHWDIGKDTKPSEELVLKTHEKLKNLMKKLTLR